VNLRHLLVGHALGVGHLEYGWGEEVKMVRQWVAELGSAR
jgi:hypothetical protein